LYSRLGQRLAMNLSLAEHVPHASAERLARSAVHTPVSWSRDDGLLAGLVGAVSASELKLSSAEAASVAIQQNRISLERLPNVWSTACEGRPSDGPTGGQAWKPGWTTASCHGTSFSRFSNAGCGTEYAVLRAGCNTAGTGGPAEGTRILAYYELAARAVTPSLRQVLGDAVFEASWYEALAQELPGFRRARAAANASANATR